MRSRYGKILASSLVFALAIATVMVPAAASFEKAFADEEDELAVNPAINPDIVESVTVQDDYSVILTTPHDTAEITSITSNLREYAVKEPLIEGTDYEILSTNEVHIFYSYLAGSERKGVHSGTDTLWINYGDTDWYYYKVNNYCINTYGYTGTKDFVYNGESSKTSVGMSLSSTKYTISYDKTKRTAIGTYTIHVKGKYPYAGDIKDTYKVVPRKPTNVTASFLKSSVTLKWKKVANCSGYQIKFYKYASNDTDEDSAKCVKTVTSSNKDLQSKTISISKSSYDYVVIRSYKTVNDKKYFSGKVKKSK